MVLEEVEVSQITNCSNDPLYFQFPSSLELEWS